MQPYGNYPELISRTSYPSFVRWLLTALKTIVEAAKGHGNFIKHYIMSKELHWDRNHAVQESRAHAHEIHRIRLGISFNNGRNANGNAVPAVHDVT